MVGPIEDARQRFEDSREELEASFHQAAAVMGGVDITFDSFARQFFGSDFYLHSIDQTAVKADIDDSFLETDWESDPLNLMPYLEEICITGWKIDEWRDDLADVIYAIANRVNSGFIWLEEVVRGY